MTQNYSNTKKRTFKHLTEIERGQIAAYIEEDLTISEIGRRMGRDKSTISREIKRGTVQQLDIFRKPYEKYFPDVGARVYEENRKNCGNHSKVMEAWEFNAFAEKKILEDKWSPDAVVGHAKRHKKFEYIPFTKTLYNWIDEGKPSIINMDLTMKLRRSTKGTKSRKHKKVLGISIEERPKSVLTREGVYQLKLPQQFQLHWRIYSHCILMCRKLLKALQRTMDRNSANYQNKEKNIKLRFISLIPMLHGNVVLMSVIMV